ncbi:MAG: T9SS type A sorting domain-containing protein [Bacteroidetes bacterium]|nr:T9SS type A sorting domain-containing protein [Bacteroidota bacterium]
MPLKTGNQWVYIHYDRLFPGPIGFWKMRVGDSVLAENGHVYYKVYDQRQGPDFFRFVRKGAEERYYVPIINTQEEALVFDPAAKTGDVWVVVDTTQWGVFTFYTMIDDIFPAYIFNKPVLVYEYIYEWSDDPITLKNYFCEEFGLLGHSMSENSESDYLIGCVLDGVVYGDTTTTVGVKEDLPKPESVWLGQNFPNPFNPETVIPVRVSRAGWVKVTVFDVSGREIQVLKQGFWEPGEYRLPFSGTGLPSGLYLVRLESDGRIQTKKIMLVK